MRGLHRNITVLGFLLSAITLVLGLPVVVKEVRR
jgi:hypothetical protein